MSHRSATIRRTTRETDVEVRLDLDGRGEAQVATGLPFLDHMLAALALHGGLDLAVRATGDLQVDDHHTSEDVALALGSTLRRALGERTGVVRFGVAYAPLDEALARVVVDLSGRPFAHVELGLKREAIGAWAAENVTHFLKSFATEARLTLHADVLRGENDHHRVEATFKALALALRQAVKLGPGPGVPSTKGVLA